MYRWLLCWRYLRTRYIALASVVSVMLGVATLVIVNSVMDGFTAEMQQRMHGILSDVIIESHSAHGLPNYQDTVAKIRQVVGEELAGITTVVHVPAMVSIDHRGETITRQINLIGIDIESYADVSDFSKYLLHPENQKRIGFDLKEDGYAPDRPGFPESGWKYRRLKAAAEKQLRAMQLAYEQEQERNRLLRAAIEASASGSSSANTAAELSVGSPVTASDLPPTPRDQADGAAEAPHDGHGLAFPELPAHLRSNDGDDAAPSGKSSSATTSPRTGATPGAEQSLPTPGPSVDAVATLDSDQAKVFDPEVDQHEGIVLGISIGSTRYRDAAGRVTDYYYVRPGDDVLVTFPSAGTSPRAINERFTVVDFYESKMSEYDATFAFVPLDKLQQYRGMSSDAVTSIQLKLRDGADLNAVRDRLRAEFPLELMVQVSTWRDLQGPLLAAVQMETTILNILLFLIIAVAGFGILATFFMIVVEKTKDIGILKSLGASGSGVASIFLGYGLLLGAFGAGVGALAGLVFVANINTVADMLETITGQEVFDPTVYYFETIPTLVQPMTVVWVVVGAVLIAVMASVLPAMRAARMHPVEALRYE
ncbi:MAG: FtsX-like permease family protein [Planctomycetota bacterium]|nr:MAG: FtsX-like permease family protein [Planctomycetota bacterium]